ncbi:hypothetical protein M5E87_12410 [Flavonifractor plautii]|nr:hypothetical protein M5E87_12410 [Flavonifractor plautii]
MDSDVVPADRDCAGRAGPVPGRMGLRLRYALWLLVLLRLLVPGTVFQTGLSVLNYVPLSQTAAAQAQPSQSGGSPSAPEAEPMPVRPEGRRNPGPPARRPRRTPRPPGRRTGGAF